MDVRVKPIKVTTGAVCCSVRGQTSSSSAIKLPEVVLSLRFSALNLSITPSPNPGLSSHPGTATPPLIRTRDKSDAVPYLWFRIYLIIFNLNMISKAAFLNL